MTSTQSNEQTKSAFGSNPPTPLRVRILVAVLVFVSASVVVLAFLSARDYGTPAEFVWQKRNAPNHWQRIGRTFALRPIYGTVLDQPFPGTLCAGNLWIKASGDLNYIRFEMSGGI